MPLTDSSILLNHELQLDLELVQVWLQTEDIRKYLLYIIFDICYVIGNIGNVQLINSIILSIIDTDERVSSKFLVLGLFFLNHCSFLKCLQAQKWL